MSLIAFVFLLTQPSAETLPQLKLQRGQELIYRGKCSTLFRGDQENTTENLSLETRVFVLNTISAGYEIAILTTLRKSGEGDPISCRQELGTVSQQGELVLSSGAKATATISLSGPPLLESGVFVGLPANRNTTAWEVAEPGRPPRSWEFVKMETTLGVRCLKLIGRQQSGQWNQLSDTAAWQRHDHGWIAAQTGIVHKMERQIDHRDPIRQRPTSQVHVRYELESALIYPEQMQHERRTEIAQTHQFEQAFSQMLTQVGRGGPTVFDPLRKRIAQFLNDNPPTPYRPALVGLQQRIEAARRGEIPAVEMSRQPIVPVALGQLAPDFVAKNLDSGESFRLQRMLGRPGVIVFFRSDSQTANESLHAVSAIQQWLGDQVWIAAVAVSAMENARQRRGEVGVQIPILDGRDLKVIFAPDSTPRFLAIDSDGVVRCLIDGYGSEVPTILIETLRRAATTQTRRDR